MFRTSANDEENPQRGTIFAHQSFFIIANFVLSLTELKRCKQFDICDPCTLHYTSKFVLSEKDHYSFLSIMG